MTGDTHGGVAHKRGPDFTSGNSFPMCDEPTPLLFEKRRPQGPFDRHGQTFTPRENAVKGRSRVEIYCKHCDERFLTSKLAAQHAAQTKHHVIFSGSYEIVPVDLHDDWMLWEDGAGVSWCHRNPEAV
jgi:hypothetical protein